MNDISIGAVGAALVAGIFSFLGLVLSKEQKVSEFRQAWINDIRDCLIAYLVHINAIADAVRMKASGQTIDNSKLLDSYSSLNKASHGIALRVNPSEKPAKSVLKAMKRFEVLASDNSHLTPENIRDIERDFMKSSRNLLKFEWTRVKRGENLFFVTKWLTAILTGVFVIIFAVTWVLRPPEAARRPALPSPGASSPAKTLSGTAATHAG